MVLRRTQVQGMSSGWLWVRIHCCNSLQWIGGIRSKKSSAALDQRLVSHLHPWPSNSDSSGKLTSLAWSEHPHVTSSSWYIEAHYLWKKCFCRDSLLLEVDESLSLPHTSLCLFMQYTAEMFCISASVTLPIWKFSKFRIYFQTRTRGGRDSNPH